jgi:Zn-finger nucleic acid-binding protein
VGQDEERELLCPSCGEKLSSRSYHNHVVEKCPGCAGMWFSAEELQRVRKDSDESIDWTGKLLEYGNKLRVKEGRRMKCPQDGAELVAIHYGPSEVVVDICTKCRGVWFDHGEFAKVARDLEDASVDKSSIDYLSDFAHEVSDLVSGEKGLSEELKDVQTTWHLFKNRLALDHPLLESFLETIGRIFT